MRTLSSGNKMNFAIFIVIVFLILFIIINAVFVGVKNQKQKYQIPANSCIYDNDYKYIELENDAQILKKWTGDYYLEEEQTKKEYKLGKYAISYVANRNSLDIFGNFYLIQEGGNVNKLTEHNTIANIVENKFYKIADRKYLIVAKDIKNNTGSLYTQNYLIIIMDKLGNTLLLNNEINIKTINEMIIETDDFEFDVANEILRYNDESINLKKVIGSTNEYVKGEEEKEQETKENVQVAKTEENKNENKEENTNQQEQTTKTINNSTATTMTTNNNNSTTIIQNSNKTSKEKEQTSTKEKKNSKTSKNTENNNNNSNSSVEQDNAWVDTLNGWINNVASGFESLYNNSSNKKEETTLSKSIMLNGVSADTASITIKYTVIDPENKYNVVYAVVSSDTENYIISLDKSANTYKMNGLQPDTNYTIKIGYKIIYSDAKIEEVEQDTMEVKTDSKSESLEFTKVGLDKAYFKLRLDSEFIYDAGCKLVVYLNDTTKVTEIVLNKADLEKTVSGYTSSFTIPDEYKTRGASLTIQLENTKINNNEINVNLNAKIINY